MAIFNANAAKSYVTNAAKSYVTNTAKDLIAKSTNSLSSAAKSALGNVARSALGSAANLFSPTAAKFYLTNSANGEEFQFAMTPESVSARTSANFRSFNIIERGEVKFPKGEQLTQINWSGTLPSTNALSYAFIDSQAWKSPAEVIKLLTRWRENGDKLRLLITETPINLDVYIRSFDYEHSGGQGNVKYSIDFLAAKDLQIKTVDEVDNEESQTQAQQLEERPPMQQPTKVICREGDNLWTIAQGKLGAGARWQDVFELNRAKLGIPTSIKVGVEVNLPF